MCTASWVFAPDHYTLFFNRDEQRRRTVAHPPRVVQAAGVRALAPVDAEAGGTWLGVNEHGVTICLLNRAADAQGPSRHASAGTTSRGLLVASLLDAGSAAEIRRRVDTVDLSRFQPFTLVAIEPGRPAILHGWDGYDVRCWPVDRSGLIATSSSLDGAVARANRERLFAQIAQPDDQALRGLHRSHLPTPGTSSICMHRGDAETVSACRVEVRIAEVSIEYTPGAPCRGADATTHRLARLEAGVPA